jgi:hypothetical protein
MDYGGVVGFAMLDVRVLETHSPLYVEAAIGRNQLILTCWAPSGLQQSGEIVCGHDTVTVEMGGRDHQRVTIPLPVDVDSTPVAIEVHNGVTEIRLQRAHPDTPRRS